MRKIKYLILFGCGIVLVSSLFGCGSIFNPPNNTTVEYKNPIIPGYAPDPSICNGPDGYFLINSSFTSYPGIPVYHSEDMINWELVSYAANNFQLKNEYTNGGLWAPTIRYINGKYYMIVRNQATGEIILTNTTNPITQAWSDPMVLKNQAGGVLNAGIDPDLFQDADKKVYIATANEDVMELDLTTGICGEKKSGWSGLTGIFSEGPHIYRIGEYYYYLMSEGGTGGDHMVTIARRKIDKGFMNPSGDGQAGWEVAPVLTTSPVVVKYLADKTKKHEILESEVERGNVTTDPTKPHNPIINNSASEEITATGHADLMQDDAGNWWVVMLGRRGKVAPDLARETYLAPVKWVDGWPVVNEGRPITERMTGPKLNTTWRAQKAPERYDFQSNKLDLHFNFIRNVDAKDWSLTEKSGYLTLYTIKKNLDGSATAGANGYNGESPSWVGVRQTDKVMISTTSIDFMPQNDTEVAGLTVVNTTDNATSWSNRDGIPQNIELIIKKDGTGRKVVVDNRGNEVSSQKIPDTGLIYLQIKCTEGQYVCSYSTDNTNYVELRRLTVNQSVGITNYNGLYVGLYASGRGITDLRTPARFDWFEYKAVDKLPLPSITPVPLPTPSVSPTPSVTPPPSVTPDYILKVEAENFSEKTLDIKVEDCKDIDGGKSIGFIKNDFYLKYNQLDFKTGASVCEARVASGGTGGKIELRLDSPTGTLIGTCEVSNTQGWQTWDTVTCNISGVSGVKDLYLVFKGSSGFLMNLNWFKVK